MRKFRVRNVRLVGVDDPGYRDFSASKRLAALTLRAKAPESKCGLLSRVIEDEVRLQLSTLLPLTTARVLVADVELGPRHRESRYWEIDAVGGTQERPIAFFEIKTTASDGSARSGLGQLTNAKRIAEHAFGPVSTMLIWVDTLLEERETPISVPSGVVEAPSIESGVTFLSGASAPVFCRVSIRGIWEAGVMHGRIADPDLLFAAEAERRDARLNQGPNRSNVPTATPLAYRLDPDDAEADQTGDPRLRDLSGLLPPPAQSNDSEEPTE